MNTIINLLSADQIEFIINAYGSITEWVSSTAGVASITIEDMML